MEHDSAPRKRSLFDRFFAYLESKHPSDRVILYILALVFIGAVTVSLLSLNAAFSKTVPNQGGTLIEGIVGTPRFVNPVLALTRTDTDLSALIYSGLMKVGPDGILVPDLAESVTVSDDGLVYNVILRNDIEFHDETPIRSDDVRFTIELIQNPDLKSPLRGNWTGVTVEVINEHELNLVLENPYTPFLENLTVGIMPEHIWGPLSIEELPFSQHNTEPVGSGPYALQNVTRNKSGLASGYTLTAFADGRGRPNIDTIVLSFYQNEQDLYDAYVEGEVMSTAGLSNETLAELRADEDTRLIEEPLPRIFTVFFNQNRSAALRDESARRALSAAIDREALIATALNGFGEPMTSPLPVGVEAMGTTSADELATSSLDAARAILRDGGWEQNESGAWTKTIDENEVTLALTVATANSSLFEDTVFYLEQTWNELGVVTSVELYEQSDLVQAVIRPRNYEALLFGTEIGRSLDLYPFWHSSQREDPGLNVALYANITTDTLLETARTTQDETERNSSLQGFASAILNEMPAIFLYSPTFVYAIDTGIEPASMEGIARPYERFANIRDWYMDDESVWQIFVRD